MDSYIQSNIKLWNGLTASNAKSPSYDIEGFKAGKLSLRELERSELGDVSGKSLLHLQCHFGLDTLSWARLGARVTGVDFSDKAIALANTLKQEVGLDASFICSDIYALPDVLNEKFDIVFTSYGVLFWLADLQRWAKIIAHFLRPGGTFYTVEHHPFANVFDENNETDLQIYYPYYHTVEPQRAESTDPDTGLQSVEYAWNFSMSEVINALITAGLRIEYIHEFSYCNTKRFSFLEQGEDGLWRWKDPNNTIPMLFSVKARL